jgi:hypothetical protein
LAQVLVAQVNVQAALSNNRIFIGDKTQLNISVTYPNTYEIETMIPDTIKRVGLEFTMPQNESFWDSHHHTTGGMEYKTSITIQAFEPDTLDVPPIPILYSHDGKLDTAYTMPLALTVFPMLPDSAGVAKPIKDIMREKQSFEDFYPYVLFAVLLLVAIGVGYYFYQKKMRQGFTLKEVAQDSPQARALRKLRQLEMEQFWQKGKYDEFCTTLSYILRSFVEEAYQIQALENTTAYIISNLEKENIAPEDLADWKHLLQNCDAVKFANVMPDISFFENAIEQAKNLVHADFAFTENFVLKDFTLK